MSPINIFILGIVEGITEFLPISSTAHLIILSKLLRISQTEFQKFFEVFIQSGAILAVLFLYVKYLWENPKIIKNIIISFIPTAIIGFFLHKIIKNIFFNSFSLIVFSMFFIGLLFVIFEKLIKNHKLNLRKSIDSLDFWQAFFIGLFQSLAVIPGVSRAGAVILAMMIFGYKRKDSAIYSFLLAMPTIFAASFFDLYQSKEIIFSSLNYIWILVFGFLTSFVFAYISVKWLIGYLEKNSLIVFGIYRMILALILLFFFKN